MKRLGVTQSEDGLGIEGGLTESMVRDIKTALDIFSEFCTGNIFQKGQA